LVGGLPPILLAGLLYLGSGLGLWVVRLIRDRGLKPAGLTAKESAGFAGSIIAGGVLGPTLFTYGLTNAAIETSVS
jgi:hypothetical protein